MNGKIILIALIIGLLAVSAAFASDEYEFDVVHSSIGFSVRHLMISNVTGNFNDFSGKLLFDEDDLTKSSVEIGIKTASINTNNENRDNHLKTADFFNAEQFPEITFKSSKVEKSGDAFILFGIFTMHGISKEISIPFEFIGKIMGPMGKQRLGFEGSTKIDRKDFGITWNKTLDEGGLAVGNEVKIQLNIEAVKK